MKQNCFNHVFGSARIKDVFVCLANAQKTKTRFSITAR